MAVLPTTAPEYVRRVRAALRRALPALLIYVVLRAVGVGWLAYRTHGFGPQLYGLLTQAYDASFYRSIAVHGYGPSPRVGCSINTLDCKYAFFPFYPGLIRVSNHLLPGPPHLLAWAIAIACALLGAWGIFAVTDLVAGQEAAVYAVALWAIVPHAMIESMAYSEPVFTAFASWALYAVLKQRWGVTVVLTIVAGLTRPVGIALVLAIEVALGVAVWGTRANLDARQKAKFAACMLLAPLGWVGWIAWVGYRTGSWNGYQHIQATWHTNFDFGRFTLSHVLAVFDTRTVYLESVVAMATLVGAVTLLVLSIQQRDRLPLLVYSLGMVVLAVGSAGYFNSKARYLLPAFPLLLPMARALARARLQAGITIVAAATVLSALYGGYLLTTFQWSP